MSPIRVLPEEVVRRIAAGEVVNRPASAVKELVENALDAGARQVRVEIENGGLDTIRVSDDGAGIPADEVTLAFRRHATSKVVSVEDIGRTPTLGFRGEALAAIAAAATVRMVTRPPEQPFATAVTYRFGELISFEQVGAPPGTVVAVKNLFENLPARRRSLDDPRKEAALCARVVAQYALAYPTVRFYLVVNGRLVLHTPGDGNRLAILQALYPRTALDCWVPVGAEAGGLGVHGYLSRPGTFKTDPAHLTVVINGRPVEARAIRRAVVEAYRSRIPRGRYPYGFLALVLPREDVDVNVHPAKLEVKLRAEEEVAAKVGEAVRSALDAPRFEDVPGVSDWRIPALPLVETVIRERPEPEFGWDKLEPLGDLEGEYLICRSEDGLYLVDPHRLDETRIFIELERQAAAEPGQFLLSAVSIPLAPDQSARLAELLPVLGRFGFAIRRVGDRTLVLEAAPVGLDEAAAESCLAELMLALDRPGEAEWERRVRAAIACRRAVKRGERLTADEQRRLLRAAAGAGVGLLCPHGYPILLRIGRRELHRHFGR